jgi:thiol-disulfide isomerase/thioredoxin
MSSACETETRKDSLTAPKERSQVVARTGPEPSVTQTPPKPSAVEAPKPKPPRDLCAKELDAPPKALPKKALSREARGAAEPAETLTVGGGKWTWINFWAAWCAPCKEEIPRLKRWERELPQLRVTFVSLDDDARQLEEFLQQQPAEGLKSTYWLKEGKEREEWLQAAAIDSNAALPIHLLVDPKGKIRCFVGGAVEDADFKRVSEIVAR